MEIEKNLVVSSSHVTQKDMELLEKASTDDLTKRTLGVIVYSTEHWIQVYVGKMADSVNFHKFSDSFRKLFEFAQKHEEGFSFMKLDCDGPVIEGFDVHEW